MPRRIHKRNASPALVPGVSATSKLVVELAATFSADFAEEGFEGGVFDRWDFFFFLVVVVFLPLFAAADFEGGVLALWDFFFFLAVVFFLLLFGNHSTTT